MFGDLKSYAVVFSKCANTAKLDTLTICAKPITWPEWCVYIG